MEVYIRARRGSKLHADEGRPLLVANVEGQVIPNQFGVGRSHHKWTMNRVVKDCNHIVTFTSPFGKFLTSGIGLWCNAGALEVTAREQWVLERCDKDPGFITIKNSSTQLYLKSGLDSVRCDASFEAQNPWIQFSLCADCEYLSDRSHIVFGFVNGSNLTHVHTTGYPFPLFRALTEKEAEATAKEVAAALATLQSPRAHVDEEAKQLVPKEVEAEIETLVETTVRKSTSASSQPSQSQSQSHDEAGPKQLQLQLPPPAAASFVAASDASSLPGADPDPDPDPDHDYVLV